MGLFDFFKKVIKEAKQRAEEKEFVQLKQGYNFVSYTQFLHEIKKYIDVSQCSRALPHISSEYCTIHLGDIKEKQFINRAKIFVIGSIESDWVNLYAEDWLLVSGDVHCKYCTSNDDCMGFIQGNLTVEKVLDIAFSNNYFGVKGSLKADYLYGKERPIEVGGTINVGKAECSVFVLVTGDEKIPPQVPVHEYLSIPNTAQTRVFPRHYPNTQIYQMDPYACSLFRDQAFWDMYFNLEEDDLDSIDLLQQLNKKFAPLDKYFFTYHEDIEDETEVNIYFKVNDDFELILDIDSLGFHDLMLYDVNENHTYNLSSSFLRFDELLLLCIRIRENDPRWKEGDLPFLLLQPLLVFGKNDRQAFDALAQQSKIILQQLGIHKVYNYLSIDEKNAWGKNNAGQWIFEEGENTDRTSEKIEGHPDLEFKHDKWQEFMKRIG